MQQQVAAAETGVELAEQRYKPEFGIDLTYGGRGGNNPDGSSRSDLFSIMVMMDLPLFHKNRQDRYKAAAIAESSVAAFTATTCTGACAARPPCKPQRWRGSRSG